MWYYIKNNHTVGPIPIDELLNDIANLEQLLNETNESSLISDNEVPNTDCKNVVPFPLIKSALSEKNNNDSKKFEKEKFNYYKYLFFLVTLILSFLILYLILV